MRRIEFHPEARVEFREAVGWYAAESVEAARRLRTLVKTALAQIAEGPHRYPRYLHRTRKFNLRKYPYLIVYRELEGIVQIIAVAHGHRRPGYWRTRLRRDT